MTAIRPKGLSSAGMTTDAPRSVAVAIEPSVSSVWNQVSQWAGASPGSCVSSLMPPTASPPPGRANVE